MLGARSILLSAFYSGADPGLMPSQLGATFFIPTLLVPLMLVPPLLLNSAATSDAARDWWLRARQ